MNTTGKVTAQFYLVLFIVILILACNSKTENLVTELQKMKAPSDNSIVGFQKSAAVVDNNSIARWDTLLFQAGDKVPNFTVFSPEGKRFNLFDELDKGKPILLISGSYTCDVARGRLQEINDLSTKYKTKLTTALIYIIEAHPVDTVSPYSVEDSIWITDENIEDGIEAKKSKTYRDRRNICNTWKDKYDLSPIVLVDNPNNEFWLTYGQAPNMAYLIKPNRKVYWRQIWLHPESLEEKIKLLVN